MSRWIAKLLTTEDANAQSEKSSFDQMNFGGTMPRLNFAENNNMHEMKTIDTSFQYYLLFTHSAACQPYKISIITFKNGLRLDDEPHESRNANKNYFHSPWLLLRAHKCSKLIVNGAWGRLELWFTIETEHKIGGSLRRQQADFSAAEEKNSAHVS